MKLTIQPMTKPNVPEMTSWQYEPPYDVYNLDHPPDEEDYAYYLDPAFAYHEILTETGEMVGFCSFGEDGRVGGGDYSQEALDIGMGIRPDWTGQGYGSMFGEAVVAFAKEHYKPSMLRVTIMASNQRAQRVWQKMGFEEIGRFDSAHNGMPFIMYTLKVK